MIHLRYELTAALKAVVSLALKVSVKVFPFLSILTFERGVGEDSVSGFKALYIIADSRSEGRLIRMVA